MQHLSSKCQYSSCPYRLLSAAGVPPCRRPSMRSSRNTAGSGRTRRSTPTIWSSLDLTRLARIDAVDLHIAAVDTKMGYHLSPFR